MSGVYARSQGIPMFHVPSADARLPLSTQAGSRIHLPTSMVLKTRCVQIVLAS